MVYSTCRVVCLCAAYQRLKPEILHKKFDSHRAWIFVGADSAFDWDRRPSNHVLASMHGGGRGSHVFVPGGMLPGLRGHPGLLLRRRVFAG